MSTPVGLVAALRRYPVKSMLGEELSEAWADERGLIGDRAFAVIDVESGSVASAKHPKRWARLLHCRARYVDPPQRDGALPPVRITLPSGVSVTTDDASVDSVLSEYLGRSVRLSAQAEPEATFDDYWPDEEGLSPEGHRNTITREAVSRLAPAGTFFDMTSFHVISSQSLAALRQAAPNSRIEAARFRPNIEIAADSARPEYVENRWVGRVLQIGDELALKLLVPTMRCVMTTLAQDGIPSDPEVLRALVRSNRVDVSDAGKYPCIGVYGSLARKVSAGGVIRRADVCYLA